MTSRTLSLTLRQLVRRMLVLLVVAALAVPVVRAANQLRMSIDGEVRTVLSFGDTVGDLLTEEGVLVAAGDQVLPAPETPLADVTTVTVLRTIEVDLVVDGRVTTQSGTWRTVQGMLDDAGVEVGPDDVLRPSPRTQLDDGDRVTIATPTTVTLNADGRSSTLATHVATVADVLALTGTAVAPDDLLDPAPDTRLTDGLSITVQRVDQEQVTEEVALPFTEEVRETSDLFTDESRVVQHGEEGLRIDTYRLTLVDGERTERELVGEEVVREPVTRIVEQGTTERPPPPPTRMADDGSVWYDLAQCESGGRWDLDGTYDGGLQFHPDTWRRNKPSGYPEFAHQASPAQQIEVGKVIQSKSGWGAWPSCASKLGLL